MRNLVFLAAMVVCLSVGLRAAGDDPLALINKAAKKSTLDQAGTHPFHLRATLAPSFERDKESHRTGEVEIWWQAPGQYRRELTSPGFHQVEVVSGGRVWQKNDGDYMPDWLDGIAESFLHPLPAQSAAMRGVPPDITKTLMGQINFDWEKPLPMDLQPSKQDVAVSATTGQLLYDDALGWGGEFLNYKGFHGRDVPMTIHHGSPEVTAKVVMLEDLPAEPADWFDASASGGDVHPLAFSVMDKTDLAVDLVVPAPALVWPEVGNTPQTGVIWTDIVLDRTAHIREPFSTISDNPAINDFMHSYLKDLQFKPVLKAGEPMQAVRHVVLRFTLRRPAGAEDLGTAKTAFEHGRAATALSAAAVAPYSLRATVTLNLSTGKVDGTYTDLWKDANHWRREAVMGAGRAVRSQDGDQQYLWADGPQSNIARLILTVVEPIPAIDTFTESGWSLHRDKADGVPALQVVLGAGPDPGKAIDPNFTAYWFDTTGRMVQAYKSKLALTYGDWQPFHGAASPRLIVGRLTPGGGIVLRVQTDELVDLDAAKLGKNAFKVAGHEWKRQFTAEVR